MIPESNRYEFRQRLSENAHTQAWLAVRRDTGASCFVKCASDAGDLPIEEKHDLLRQSFRLQHRFKSASVHIANFLHVENGRLFVEYPYLSPERLSEVSLPRLLESSREQLVRLATIVDYIHLLGIVHCDLKLDNFRLLKHARGERIILTDLDNVQESGKPAGHRIFGTVDCIAPEVLNNDRVCCGSDLYSLGRSLGISLHRLDGRGRAEIAGQVNGGIDRLVESLTQDSPASRPELLLRGLRAAGLIEEPQYLDGLKAELAMLLLTAYRSFAAGGDAASIDLQRDLFYAVKLYSIPEEICADLQRTLQASPRRALEAVRALLTAGDCARCGEYWHLTLPDDVILDVFSRLSGATCADDADGAARSHATPPEPAEAGIPSARSSLRQYLTSKTRVAALLRDGETVPGAELFELAKQAVSLQRPREACEFIKPAIEQAVPHSDEQIRLLPFYVHQLGASGQLMDARRAAADGLKLILDNTHPAEEIEVKRLSAWLLEYEGDHGGAERELKKVISEAAGLQQPLVQAKAMSDLATVFLTSGRLDEAVAAYEQALSFITAHGLESRVPGTFVSYAILSFQAAQYQKAIARAKTAIKYIDPHSQNHLLLYVCQYIALGHTRLGEYGKADYWLGRCLGLIHVSSTHYTYSGYYGNLGWSQMVRGDLAEAEVSLYRALEMAPPGPTLVGACNTYKNLAEVALYRGRADECERLIGEARKALADFPEQVTAAELDLIAFLKSFYCDTRRDLDRLVAVMKVLQSHGCRYYAAVALLVALIEADEPWRVKNKSFLQRVVHELPLDQSPLFQALNHIAEPFLQADATAEAQIAAARHAYRHLESADLWFLAMITCSAIARLLFSNGQPRLGARFIRQAVSLAGRLSNERFKEELERRLRDEASLLQERRVLVQSFEGIADILANVGQELDPLPRLLKFAVTAVEAERGVLLLSSHDTDELRVRAYVGCEADDLKDVISFSRTIPRNALTSMSPVFISDALSDAATSKYKSIIAHNIRSVICVPIVVDGRARGVIYLDHHTIPALFDDEDLTFVKALSKFASLVFDTYARLRTSRNQADYLASGLAEFGLGSEFVTQNESLRQLLAPLPQIAASDAGVLIRGESGTGKEIICQMIHKTSPRKDGPFVKLNCAAITATLVESELFGVADRTATGVGARKGKFEAADGGTLFLDEIGDMPLAVQAKVLRVLEYQEFEAVGSNTTISTDVRFVFATNKDLHEMVKRGQFREDLYYRICGVEIVIAPLRDRPDDVEPLCRHFTGLFAKTTRKPIRLSSEALDILESYHWPGNVRELRNVIERLSLLHPGETITVNHLPADMVRSAEAREPASLTAQSAERARILRALTQHDWNQSAAARSLGMSLTTLRRKTKKYGLRRP